MLKSVVYIGFHSIIISNYKYLKNVVNGQWCIFESDIGWMWNSLLYVVMRISEDLDVGTLSLFVESQSYNMCRQVCLLLATISCLGVVIVR